MIVTDKTLREIAPAARKNLVAALAPLIDGHAPQAGVTTELRMAHFLAQAAHESAGFTTLVEYWGPTAAQKGYEGREDLGNSRKGDGRRYKGRGIFQLTGRANYRIFGAKLGVDLESNPDLAAAPDIAVRAAFEFWRAKGLNSKADADDIRAITKRINGGTNGLDDRIRYLARAKAVLGENQPAPARSRPSPEMLRLIDVNDKSLLGSTTNQATMAGYAISAITAISALEITVALIVIGLATAVAAYIVYERYKKTRLARSVRQSM